MKYPFSVAIVAGTLLGSMVTSSASGQSCWRCQTYNGYFPPASWQILNDDGYPSTYEGRTSRPTGAAVASGYVPQRKRSALLEILKSTERIKQADDARLNQLPNVDQDYDLPKPPPPVNQPEETPEIKPPFPVPPNEGNAGEESSPSEVPLPELSEQPAEASPSDQEGEPADLEGPDPEPVPNQPATSELLQGEPSTSTFAELLALSSMKDKLGGDEAYTIVVPNNDAFTKLPARFLEAVKDDQALLDRIVSNHMFLGSVASDELEGKEKLTTLIGEELPVGISDEHHFIGHAKVVEGDKKMGSATVHIVDAILLPPLEE